MQKLNRYKTLMVRLSEDEWKYLMNLKNFKAMVTIEKSKELEKLAELLKISQEEVEKKVIGIIEKHTTIEFECNGFPVMFFLEESTGIKDPFYWSIHAFSLATIEISLLFNNLKVKFEGVCPKCGGEIIEEVKYNYSQGYIEDTKYICENCN